MFGSRFSARRQWYGRLFLEKNRGVGVSLMSQFLQIFQNGKPAFVNQNLPFGSPDSSIGVVLSPGILHLVYSNISNSSLTTFSCESAPRVPSRSA